MCLSVRDPIGCGSYNGTESVTCGPMFSALQGTKLAVVPLRTKLTRINADFEQEYSYGGRDRRWVATTYTEIWGLPKDEPGSSPTPKVTKNSFRSEGTTLNYGLDVGSAFVESRLYV